MKRSAGKVMARLVGLVKPLAGYMTASVVMGTIGYLCATLISVFAGYALLSVIGHRRDLSILLLCIGMVLCAIFRAILKYGEQGCNHYIAFRLLALIRDRIFRAMRRLAPATR